MATRAERIRLTMGFLSRELPLDLFPDRGSLTASNRAGIVSAMAIRDERTCHGCTYYQQVLVQVEHGTEDHFLPENSPFLCPQIRKTVSPLYARQCPQYEEESLDEERE